MSYDPMAPLYMRLPTAQQGALIKEAIEKGSIPLLKDQVADIRICCYMGWLAQNGGNQFNPTKQGIIVAEYAKKDGEQQPVDYSAMDKAAMKGFSPKLPSKAQQEQIGRAVKRGYTHHIKGSYKTVEHICQMGWLSLREGGRFYLTHQGKIVIESLE